MHTIMPTSSPVPVMPGCYHFQNNTRGAPSQSASIIMPNKGDPAIDFDACCNECFKDLTCVGFSYYQGNQCDVGGMCVLFNNTFGVGGVELEDLRGWSLGSLLRDETFTVQSRHQQNELAIMFQSWVVSIVVSTCFAVGLYCFSIKKESEVKSNIIKRRFFTMDKITAYVEKQKHGENRYDDLAKLKEKRDKLRELSKMSGDHKCIIFIGLTHLKFTLGWLFLAERYNIDGTGAPISILLTLCLALPVACHALLIMYLLYKECGQQKTMELFQESKIAVSMVTLAGLVSIDALKLFTSKTFGSIEANTLFNVSFAGKWGKYLHSVGFLGHMFGDLPHMIVQMVIIQRDGFASLTVASLSTSGLCLLIGLVQKASFISNLCRKLKFCEHASSTLQDNCDTANQTKTEPVNVSGMLHTPWPNGAPKRRQVGRKSSSDFEEKFTTYDVDKQKFHGSAPVQKRYHKPKNVLHIRKDPEVKLIVTSNKIEIELTAAEAKL